MDMYLIYMGKKLGQDKLLTFLLTDQGAANLATGVKLNPGVGKKYFVFDALPDGNPTGVDFTDAPVVSTDVSINQAAIDAMLATPPWDALSY